MLYNVIVAVGAMVALVFLFGIFHLLAERMRTLGGECGLDSFRCMGCLASGRCHRDRRTIDTNPRPVRTGRPA